VIGSALRRSDAFPRPPLDRLERDFIMGDPGPLPSGLVCGRFLGEVDSPGARRPHVRGLDFLLFRSLRWGLDLDDHRWWFEHPRLAAGKFRVVLGPSRWRDTRVLQLHYDVSRLPIRRILYDEVKPLPDGRILGLGGIDAARGEGDHFFFELVPVSDRRPMGDRRPAGERR
jgi:hypothetical protein